MNTTRFLVLASLTLALLSACRPPQPPAPSPSAEPAEPHKVYAATGVVIKVLMDQSLVVVDHEEIPGFMEAMKMPLDVKDTNELAGLEPGDRILFDLLITSDEGWIQGITRIGHVTLEPPAPAPREPVRQVRLVEPLEVGDPLPDYPFTNQFGVKFSLADYRGQVLGFNFFFTRCPYPSFCPRMTSNFKETQNQLAAQSKGPKNWQLLSISFDTRRDTPEVLKQYGRKYDYDPARWTLATGALIDLDAITEQFGLEFSPDGDFFSHNVRTVVVDPAGIIRNIIVGNTWKPEELVEAMVQAAAPAPRAPSTP